MLSQPEEIISQPWHLPPPDLKEQNSSNFYWKSVGDGGYFRLRRKNILLQPLRQQIQPTLSSDDSVLEKRVIDLPKIISHIYNVTNSIQFANRLENLKRRYPPKSTYNPLPYGDSGYGLQLPRPTAVTQGVEEWEEESQIGLPFARRPIHREEKPRILRLPIPDSEIHNRIPVKASIMRAYQDLINKKNDEKSKPSTTTEKPVTAKSVDMDSFRVLVDVIKSMIDSSQKPLVQ